jgi:TRAP-type C4-dicarboxylate transport system substrate-binding protein
VIAGEQVLRGAEVPRADQPPVQPAIGDLISKKFWDTLSADEKKIIDDAAVESAKYQRQQVPRPPHRAGELKKGGMQVNELAPAELAKLREKMKPVIDKHGAAIAETVKELQAELAKQR